VAIKNETWKPIAEHEGSYEVSDSGRIRSLDRMACAPKYFRNRKGCVLKPSRIRNGYLIVSLYKDSISKTKLVHILVLKAFLGVNPGGKQCNHIDGDKTNNKINNLEWCTPSENGLHKCRVLLKCIGEGHKNSKLTEDDVFKIRAAYNRGGVTQRYLAQRYSVSHSTVNHALNRKSWRHVV